MIREDFVYTPDLGLGFVISLAVLALLTSFILVMPSIRRFIHVSTTFLGLSWLRVSLVSMEVVYT